MRFPWPRWFETKSAPSLTSMVHDGRQSSSFFDMLLPSTALDWSKEVDDSGKRSSVLAAPLNWIMRTFPEAPLIVEKRAENQWEAQPGDPLVKLIGRPNDFYTADSHWMAMVLDVCFGNGYFLKIRNASKKVIQLWWVPRQMMTPRYPTDGSVFISHYDYKPKGTTYQIDPKDVIHVRFGIDPDNPRLGLSPLGSLVREVAIDDHASNFTASILKNLGIIGVVISPKEKNSANPEDVKSVKAYIKSAFTGDKRAEPLVLGAPTDVNVMQYNMQGFDVGPIRDVSEERVCAALGIPAAVVGFGTGLQQTKVGATMKEMRQLAWIGGIIPLHRIIAAEVQRSLLPEFHEDTENYRVRFDAAEVRALWETPTEHADRVRKDFQATLITRGEARQETGRAAGDKAAEYYTQPVGGAAPTDPQNPPANPAPGPEE